MMAKVAEFRFARGFETYLNLNKSILREGVFKNGQEK